MRSQTNRQPTWSEARSITNRKQELVQEPDDGQYLPRGPASNKFSNGSSTHVRFWNVMYIRPTKGCLTNKLLNTTSNSSELVKSAVIRFVLLLSRFGPLCSLRKDRLGFLGSPVLVLRLPALYDIWHAYGPHTISLSVFTAYQIVYGQFKVRMYERADPSYPRT